MKNVQNSRKYFAELLSRRKNEILNIFENEEKGFELAGWFLGPKSENAQLLKYLVEYALDVHIKDRIDTYPDDPIYITDELKSTYDYKKSVANLVDESKKLMEQLKGSVPFWSYRWQSHMNWDTTLPGIIGYFIGMLYNPNNVAAEASPVTTLLEMEVGNQLNKMLGYNTDDNIQPKAWGHITCDGSIANNEAMWAARNLKFYPVSLSYAIRNNEIVQPLETMLIQLPNGQKKTIGELSDWDLLNIQVDEILSIPQRVEEEFGIPIDTFSGIMNLYSIQNIGFDELKKYMKAEIKSPVVMAPSHMHYSWPKSAAVLGIGANNVIKIHVDLDARMRIDKLREAIDKAISEKSPVLMVVAVIGSTEESAVDPLREIIKLRKAYNREGIDFIIHCDAAWGGYFASLLRPAENRSAIAKLPYSPALMMSEYVRAQYECLGMADSITIDPHKAGYIQYPAGGLCYRNGAMRNLVSFTAPVVYHGGVDPTVGVYGLEGSKPGAAAAATFLSHSVIPLNQTGYGRLLGQCLFNSKRIYSDFITMAEPDDPFIIKAFQRLPAEKREEPKEKINDQYNYIKHMIVPKTNEEITENPETMQLFTELGSDQIIITYAFNFKINGEINTNIDKMNNLNFNIFKRLSLSPDHNDVNKIPMMVTQSQFSVEDYGKDLVDNYKQRLGIIDDTNSPVTFLITTTMNPWISSTAAGNFIPELRHILRQTVLEEIQNLDSYS